MLSRDSEDGMWSRIVFELVIWPQEVTLTRRTQSSGPMCLWQCLFCEFSLHVFATKKRSHYLLRYPAQRSYLPWLYPNNVSTSFSREYSHPQRDKADFDINWVLLKVLDPSRVRCIWRRVESTALMWLRSISRVWSRSTAQSTWTTMPSCPPHLQPDTKGCRVDSEVEPPNFEHWRCKNSFQPD